MHNSSARNAPSRIVCLGSSAGGLDAYTSVLAGVPADSGMAFVIVHHQSRYGKPLLLDILPRFTKMRVKLIRSGGRIRPNCVYIVPAQNHVTVADGMFVLGPRPDTSSKPSIISHFLESLAENYKERAIAVILSGAGSDGADAMHAVKEAGGITFAQSSATAQFAQMPESAALTGFVDFRLSPQDIASALEEISLAFSAAQAQTTPS